MGRLRGRRGSGGYILLDVLAAMTIAVIGLAVFLASLGAAVRIVTAQGQRIQRVIEQRNGDATDQALLFQGK